MVNGECFNTGVFEKVCKGKKMAEAGVRDPEAFVGGGWA